LAGEEIIIDDASAFAVKLVPFKPEKKARSLGLWEGQIWMADNFNETPEDFSDIL
jgi:antitoxin (DNA-binding transcriptional repressor) of toxin-antitoxin stability system